MQRISKTQKSPTSKYTKCSEAEAQASITTTGLHLKLKKEGNNSN
jgi:hypothetical protein